jgi:hypothetical protein
MDTRSFCQTLFQKKSSKRHNLVTIPFENAIFDVSGGNVLRDNGPEYHGRPYEQVDPDDTAGLF